MPHNWNEGVSIVIPTYKRPHGIKNALESLVGQQAGQRAVEIVVADNDPNASAKDFVTTFAKTSDIEIIYKHVPDPGVSCLLYTSPSPRDRTRSRMPSSA